MDYVISAPRQPYIPVQEGMAFPVRRVWCVGRNYLDHVKEMGNDPTEPPFFFSKPSDAITVASRLPYPPATEDLQHEVELLIAVGHAGRFIDRASATKHIWGAGVAVDLTRRDLQAEAKTMGRPWSMAKGFDSSAPVGALVPLTTHDTLNSGRIWLDVNGGRRQEADLADMIWPVSDIIAGISQFVLLEPGDVILTGSPAGVGPLNPGDIVSCGADGVPSHKFEIVDQVQPDSVRRP